MMLPSLNRLPFRVELATVPEQVDWAAVQQRFPERPLDSLSPKRRIEHVAVASALDKLAIDEIRHDAYGKPFSTLYSISISHATDASGQIWAAVAASPGKKPLGIDLERPRPQLTRVAPRIFSNSERLLISDDPSCLNVLWNIKEAGWKAFGPNLDYRTDIQTLSVPSTSVRTEGAMASVRICDSVHFFFVAQLPIGLSLAAGPLSKA